MALNYTGKLWVVMMVLFQLNQPVQAGVDDTSELTQKPGYQLVQQICTQCHSAKLIVQNRNARQGWLEIIQTMQSQHGLAKLKPETQQQIIDYLSQYYAPVFTGRRAPLIVEHWSEPEKSGQK